MVTRPDPGVLVSTASALPFWSTQVKLVVADGSRPTIEPVANSPGVPVAGGVVTVTLKPYATAVLTKK